MRTFTRWLLTIRRTCGKSDSSRRPTGRCFRRMMGKNGGFFLSNRRYSNAEQKERIRQRVRVQIDEANYQFFPERKEPDYYDNDVCQRVGVYVRVSTDDPRQTTSYELQKKYYE